MILSDYMLTKFLYTFLFFLYLQPVYADKIKMGFALNIPPYIFQNDNNGIEIDIISEALAYKGHTIEPSYYPLGRIPISFKQNLIDAAMGDMGVDLTAHSGFYATPAVIYVNKFITLEKRNFIINKPSDMNGLSVISFQGAVKRYPQWLSEPLKDDSFYEVSNQLRQVRLLYLERFDVVLSDIYIFKYYSEQLKKSNSTLLPLPPIVMHTFVENNPSNYRPVFKSKKIRDDFNFGLKKLKETGRFQAIYDSYLN